MNHHDFSRKALVVLERHLYASRIRRPAGQPGTAGETNAWRREGEMGAMRRIIILVTVAAMAALAAAPSWAGSRAKGAQPKGTAPENADFNGDGFSDLAIGTSSEDLGPIVDAGAVAVFYGSNGGLQATSPDDQFWNQDSVGVQGAAQTGDKFGSAVAAGDFNNDGFTDLAIGIPFEDVGTVVGAGSVEVLYGSAGGLQATSPDDQFWNQDSTGVKGSAETDDQFGTALATGDFNSDGFADLAIGSPFDEPEGVTDAGETILLYGTAGGLQATSPDDQLWHQNSTGVVDKAEVGDEFGSSLAAGDFNGDGFDDLAIGVPLENVGAIADAGAVNVLYGSAGGLQADAPADQFWNQDSTGVLGDAGADDAFGSSLSAGDFNADGYADLAIGIPKETVSGKDNAGAAAVLYGSVTQLQADAPDDQLWNRDSASVMSGAETSDKFGRELAAGDFNGDGFADLCVGVSKDDVDSNSIHDAGSVSVLYGSPGGLQATSPNDQFWSQNSDSVLDKSEKADHFGDAVAGGDFNGDGFEDLAIGVPDEDLSGGANAGMMNVLYGSSGGLQATSPNDQQWNQNTIDVADDAEAGDHFGNALAA
jgi:hypothetical protein